MTDFLSAILDGRVDEVRRFSEAGNDASLIQSTDEDGNTALHLACRLDCTTKSDQSILRQSKLAILKFLTHPDVDLSLNTVNSLGESPSLVAVKSNFTEAVCYLLDTAGQKNLDLPDKAGDNAFTLACRRNLSELALLFVNRASQISPNHLDAMKQNGLSIAIVEGHFVLAQRLLLELAPGQEELDYNSVDSAGDTPFHHACRSDDIETIRAFLKRLAVIDLTVRNKAGELATDLCSEDHRRMVQAAVLIHEGNYTGLKRPHSDFQYAEKDVLGSGNFGDVYQGNFEGKAVAIKVPKGSRYWALAETRAFLKEVKIWAALGRHQNVIPLLAYCDSPPLFVSPACISGDMTSYLARLRYSPTYLPHARLILLGIARGMSYLHSARQIAPIDLNPANILISLPPPGLPIPLIADFGASRVRIADMSAPAASASDASVLNPELAGAVGTVQYMPPEALREYTAGNKQITRRMKSDVWAMGVIAAGVAVRSLIGLWPDWYLGRTRDVSFSFELEGQAPNLICRFVPSDPARARHRV
jgi:ankyrin repeat protein